VAASTRWQWPTSIGVAAELPAAISQQGPAKLVRRYAAVVPERLAHPHALRSFYATTLSGERDPDPGLQGPPGARVDRGDRSLPRRASEQVAISLG